MDFVKFNQIVNDIRVNFADHVLEGAAADFYQYVKTAFAGGFDGVAAFELAHDWASVYGVCDPFEALQRLDGDAVDSFVMNYGDARIGGWDDFVSFVTRAVNDQVESEIFDRHGADLYRAAFLLHLDMHLDRAAFDALLPWIEECRDWADAVNLVDRLFAAMPDLQTFESEGVDFNQEIYAAVCKWTKDAA